MPVITYREALHQALVEEMRRDERVFVMGEDVGLFEGAYKVTAGLMREFGNKRVKDTPISEQAIIGSGVGAAMLGLRPVVEIMTLNFIMVAMDQIVNSAPKAHYMSGGQVKVPLVVRTPEGAGHQLGAEHSHCLDAWFAHLPGLKVVAPSMPADAKGLLKTAIRDDNPVLFLENLALYTTRGEVPEGEHLVPFGKADVKRQGEDLTIIGLSRMTLMALEAAKRLEEQGISAEVVDIRSLRPLDVDTIINSVKKTNRAIVVEEGWRSFGFGAEVAARIYEEAFDYLDAPVVRIASAEVPMPYSKPLEQAALPSVDRVVEAAKKLAA
ncbi:MAG: pyruvate dehydrogenase complex E1 component subunit beta [Chloroflexi bacterium]|nr:pyruvate dehydrogenase complex E1 component subunit beta [Chloroflexota bacterium]